LFDSLPLIYSKSEIRALFRQQPEHFQVDEELSFQPDGSGDHLYLNIRKRNTNSDWLARDLASKASLRPVDIGYAGRKDRFAVTSQWFSLHLPGAKSIDLSRFQTEDYQVINHCRHSKKLRRGELAYNRFKLQLSNFEGSYNHFEKRILLVAKEGFPNYFGPQRFGHNFSNINKARDMLSGKLRIRDRNKRSIYLSAARSYLFNLVLAERIEKGYWQTPLKGDRFWDNEEKRLSDTLPLSDEVMNNLQNGKFSITGPMAGDGPNMVSDEALDFETIILSKQKELCTGIANSRVQWQRRALRIIPGNLSCKKNSTGVEIEFTLSPGAYATSLLRELMDTSES